MQHQLMDEIGGISHAEHGIGDYAETDLTRAERTKLVAHRLLNDIKGISNPGGSWNKAFKQAIQDKGIAIDGINCAQKALEREVSRNTLLNWSDKTMTIANERLKNNIASILAGIER
jgi:D-lactate dehydrogenase